MDATTYSFILRELTKQEEAQKEKVASSSPTLLPHVSLVVALFVVNGGGMLLAGFLCSLLTLAGLSCWASWSVWTRMTVFFALVVVSGGGICWAGLAGCSSRCVPCCRLQARDARHHGRYGPEGQLRGESLADMVPVVQSAENCGFSAVAVHQGRRHFLRGSEAYPHGPCDHGDSLAARGYGGRCPFCSGCADFPVVVQRQIPMVSLTIEIPEFFVVPRYASTWTTTTRPMMSQGVAVAVLGAAVDTDTGMCTLGLSCL